ncbi:MAG: sulfite exporter TauE/SafE family protein [Actinomycetota bacterium]
MSDAVRFLLTVGAGFVTGILSAMFGIGGAVVSTPAIRLLWATALQAVGSTLPSVLPSSVTGSIRYRREGLILPRVVAWTALGGVPASVIGSRLTSAVPGDGHLLMLATAAMVGYTAYRTAFPPDRPVGADGEPRPPRREPWRLIVVGLLAGGLSGLLGIGGGILMVPAFSIWIGIPLRQTIATSLTIVGVLAIPGTLTHWALGHIDWTYAFGLALGVVPGAWLGARFTINASELTLRRTVGAALGVIALAYAVGETIALLG